MRDQYINRRPAFATTTNLGYRCRGKDAGRQMPNNNKPAETIPYADVRRLLALVLKTAAALSKATSQRRQAHKLFRAAPADAENHANAFPSGSRRVSLTNNRKTTVPLPRPSDRAASAARMTADKTQRRALHISALPVGPV